MSSPAPDLPRASRGPRAPRAGDPYGVGPIRPLVAPILAVVGLLLVSVLTFDLLTGQIPFIGTKSGGNGQPGDGSNGGPQLTPAPSNVVIIPKEATFKGSIVYAKAGNIWIQDAGKATQLTSSGGDSMPSWSPDGLYVYYIRTTDMETDWPEPGQTNPSHYLLQVPDLMRVKADGSADPERLATGKFKQGKYSWAYWIREPVMSPDGKTIALVSDAPNPEVSDVVLQFFDMATKKITSPDLPDSGILGHQDPEWRPDGKLLLYVKNGRDGSRGAPTIIRYDPASGGTKVLTTAGYDTPSYSPDGRYIAATRTSTLGTDVVILDASNGLELLRITNDQSSFSPTWSPAGDGIAFLHLDGQTVDLQLARLDLSSGTPAVKETIPLTEVSGLDADSRPHWFIPAKDLPTASATPTPAPTASPSATASGASGASPSP